MKSKRIIALLLVLVMTIGLLSGCGKGTSVHIYTRGEWINELASIFSMDSYSDASPRYSDLSPNDSCFAAVQACVEAEVLSGEGAFEPNERADVQFAIVTAVKAIGLDYIAKSVDGKELKTDDEIVDYFNERTGIKYISGSALYMDTAAEIVEQVEEIYSTMTLAQTQDIKYCDRVFELEEEQVLLYPDGETASIDVQFIQEGDIYYIKPCARYPQGKNMKVVSYSGNTITYEEPACYELFESMQMTGTYDLNVLSVTPLSEGVTVTGINGVTPTATTNGENGIVYLTSADAHQLKTGDAKVEFKISEQFKSGNASVSVSGTVKLVDLDATVDVLMYTVMGVELPVVEQVLFRVDETIEADLSITGELSKSIDLARIPCEFCGVGVDFVLSVKIGIEGKISFIWTVETSQSIEYTNYVLWQTKKLDATAKKPQFKDVEVKVAGYVRATVKAEIVFMGFGVANTGVTFGVEATAKWKASHPECMDAACYLSGNAFVGAESEETLLGKLGVKASITIWDSESSPLRKAWHFENGDQVEECMYDKTDPSDEEDLDSIFDELKDYFDQVIEDIKLDYFTDKEDGIKLAAYYAAVEETKSARLGIEALPKGYSTSDLVYTSSDTSVATVDGNGYISGVNSGSCLITVSTKDGKFSSVCAITILASYDVDFTPLV